MHRRMLVTTTSLAVAGGTGACAAVTLNPDGLGQALVYPYYTVNEGQDTLLTLSNASDLGKVARVRFHEGYNGRVVLDVLVLLSPHDRWTAAITAAGDEAAGAILVTRDRSCTLPAIPAGGQAFSSANYTGGGASPYDRPDSGPQAIARTREGHIDVVVDGDIVPDSATDRLVRHMQTGVVDAGTPACAEVHLADIGPDLVAPANTLGGSVGIVDVAQGTYYSYDAQALADFTRVPFVEAGTAAGYDELARANSGDGIASATVVTGRGVVTLDFARGIDAVSAVFMAETVHNDVLLDPALGAATDWVLTFPTRRYYVDGQAYDDTPRAPFTARFASGGSPVSIDWRLYDNEALYVSDPCGPICGVPPPQAPLMSPHEVNVVAFRALADTLPSTSGVFGSRLATNLVATYPGWKSGQADLDLAADDRQVLATGSDSAGPTTLFGLPVAGFMAYEIVNANAQAGRLANYSGAFVHRTSVRCISGSPTPAPPLACE